MNQLVAYYNENPLEAQRAVEINQAPISAASGLTSVEGAVRAGLVYVAVHRPTGSLLVPFGAYDEWSLRDRYNEAIRIMNSLGASSIVIESFREVSNTRGLKAKIAGNGANLSQERMENSAFDFRHEGAGSPPRDPRPLSWPDEPGFAAAVASVLENASTEVELNIKSDRTHAINGDLGLQLNGIGFELGAMSQQSGATSLHIRANFPAGRKGWK